MQFIQDFVKRVKNAYQRSHSDDKVAIMSEIDEALAQGLNLIARSTSSNTDRRLTAVRWFNRLYYDLGTWQKSFVSLVNTYPGFKSRPKRADYKAFQGKIESFEEDIEAFGRGTGGGTSDFCARLDFLGARFTVDFQWLREEDPKAFTKLEDAIGLVRRSPADFSQLSEALCNHFYAATNRILGEYKETHGEFGRVSPSVESARIAIERYREESANIIENIRRAAWNVGITLLSVEEYEEALKRDGTRNPNLIVLGEMTISGDTYNVGQAAAVGPNAAAHQASLSQTWSKVEKNIDLPRLAEELGRLRNAMKEQATNPDHDIAVGAVATAEKSAKDGDGPTSLQHLKSAGLWALTIAEKIGVDVATAALKEGSGHVGSDRTILPNWCTGTTFWLYSPSSHS